MPEVEPDEETLDAEGFAIEHDPIGGDFDSRNIHPAIASVWTARGFRDIASGSAEMEES